MQILQRLIVISLIAFYALALVLDRSAGVLFAILIAAGLAAACTPSLTQNNSLAQTASGHWPLILALASPLMAILCNQISNGSFSGRSIDLPFRLALFPLVFWAIMQASSKHLKLVQWAFVVGATGAAIKMYLLTDGGVDRYVTDFIPSGIFAEMGTLLAVFAVFAIHWDDRWSRWNAAVKLLALCAGLYTAYLSGSRSTWTTIPFFIGIAYFSAPNLPRLYKTVATGICIAVIGTTLSYGKIATERLIQAKSDIHQYEQGTLLDSSIGTRFQLWKASWILFKEHPISGVGVENYRSSLATLADQKIITSDAATYVHSHNEILFMMAKLGTLGLLAILAVYFVPMYYFGRDLRHEDREIRGSAAMGMSLCVGIAVGGLTDVFFMWWEVFPFYAIGIALFLSCIIKRKEVLASGHAIAR